METPHVKVGVGAIIFKDGKILLGKRKNSFGAGEYCLPGGHLEYMEGFEECLRREVLEECGLEIKNIKFITLGNVTKYAPIHHVTIGFSADWSTGEPMNLEPHKSEGWDWYDVDELPDPLFHYSKLLIESYKKGNNYYDIKK